ncbi:putative glycoside hydrolase, partial [Domibacillus sp. 8LH]|uniref:putative glycoside hydrolase n=1 Tax=Domibacillus sp. 8LH TaxID=3073900 RepID=UPI0031777790
RVQAVTDFVAYAKEEMSNYDVDVAVDIFGYAATIEEAPGIGQNFSKNSDNVDVISSMINPSHWTS